jgi:hypothetical protein
MWLQTTLDQTFKPDFFFDAFAVPFSELLDNRATFVGLGLDVSFKVLVCFSFTGLEFSLAVVFRFAGVFAGLAVSSFCFSSTSFVALVPPAECQKFTCRNVRGIYAFSSPISTLISTSILNPGHQ